ncbi:hypothetical protein QZH41_006738 [Actinostola sp. cb2023]|nr:hypothetical protein QZH41_006738 [Actinostola sp. cb2023]
MGRVAIRNRLPVYSYCTVEYHADTMEMEALQMQETQCIPTPIAWYFQKLPKWFHRLSTIVTYVIEIGLPFLFFIPVRSLRMLAYCGQVRLVYMLVELMTMMMIIIMMTDINDGDDDDNNKTVLLQMLIMLTGNYSFFNLLTIVLCISLLDDNVITSRYTCRSKCRKKKAAKSEEPKIDEKTVGDIVIDCPPTSDQDEFEEKPLRVSAFSPDDFQTFVAKATIAAIWIGFLSLLVEVFGAFARILLHSTSKLQKHSSLIQCTAVTLVTLWLFAVSLEYNFRYKPGNVYQPPPFVAPHQPRLDWQMWFAALESFESNPWFLRLLSKLLEGEKDVLALMGENKEFTGSPPKYIRAQLFLYHYTENTTSPSDVVLKSGSRSQAWWMREYVGNYTSFIASNESTNFLQQILKHKRLYKKPLKEDHPGGFVHSLVVSMRHGYKNTAPQNVINVLFFVVVTLLALKMWWRRIGKKFCTPKLIKVKEKCEPPLKQASERISKCKTIISQRCTAATIRSPIVRAVVGVGVHEFWMACTGENYPYPRPKKSMEDDILTIDDVTNHVTRRGAYDGVRIREFDDGNVNPVPVRKDEEESDNLWEEFLSPNKLTVNSPFFSLQNHSDRVSVDPNEGENGGELDPNALRMGELYVAFNDISDVSPVGMLDNLEVLDLEGNLIDDLSQEMADYEYRKAIHQAVPGLKVLDDEPFLVEKVGGKPVLRDMPDSAKNAKVPDHLKAEWQLINDGLKAVENEQDNEEEPSNPRPSSAKSKTRPKTAVAKQRPASAARQRPSSAARQHPGSAFGQRPGSSLGSSGSQSELTGIFQMGDDSSDLTHGSGEVICGNISKALKARRKNIGNFKSTIPPFSSESQIHVPEKSYVEEQPNTPSKTDIFEELKDWRQQFAKYQAPAVWCCSDRRRSQIIVGPCEGTETIQVKICKNVILLVMMMVVVGDDDDECVGDDEFDDIILVVVVVMMMVLLMMTGGGVDDDDDWWWC